MGGVSCGDRGAGLRAPRRCGPPRAGAAAASSAHTPLAQRAARGGLSKQPWRTSSARAGSAPPSSSRPTAGSWPFRLASISAVVPSCAAPQAVRALDGGAAGRGPPRAAAAAASSTYTPLHRASCTRAEVAAAAAAAAAPATPAAWAAAHAAAPRRALPLGWLHQRERSAPPLRSVHWGQY